MKMNILLPLFLLLVLMFSCGPKPSSGVSGPNEINSIGRDPGAEGEALLNTDSGVRALEEILIYQTSALQTETIAFLKTNPGTREALSNYLEENPDARGFLVKKAFEDEDLRTTLLQWIRKDSERTRSALALLNN